MREHGAAAAAGRTEVAVLIEGVIAAYAAPDVGDTFDANGNFLSDNVDTTTQFDGNNMLVGYNAPVTGDRAGRWFTT